MTCKYQESEIVEHAPPQLPNLIPYYITISLYILMYVGRVVGGRCQAHIVPDNVHQLHVQQPPTYKKPEAASAVLGS